MPVDNISIIGTGSLGSSLCRTLLNHQITVKSIFNRSGGKAEKLAIEFGIGEYGTFPDRSVQLGELIFLTVSDYQIKNVASKLAELTDDFTGFIVAHCSGIETSDALEELRNKGADVASFHPVQTFTDHSDLNLFEDIYISIEGDEKAVEVLKQLSKLLEAKPLSVTPDDKKLLHVAAVLASNYLITLIKDAGEIGSMGTLSEFEVRKALLPLSKTTLNNTESEKLSAILTGPVVRGDITTVENHLKMLEHKTGVQTLYKLMGKRTLLIAIEKGGLTKSQIDRFEQLFDIES